jgi:hypothetical protein
MARSNWSIYLKFHDNGVVVVDGYSSSEPVYEKHESESWCELVGRALGKHREFCLTEAEKRDKLEEENA